MLPRVLILLRPLVDYVSETSLPRELEPIKAFGRGLGRGEPFVSTVSAGVPAIAWRDGDDDELVFTPEVYQLERGSVLVVKQLRSISDEPLVVVKAIGSLIGRGVSVYVLTFGASASTVIEPLAELAELAGDLSAKLEAVELDALRAEATARREAYEVMREATFQALRQGRIPFGGVGSIPVPPGPDDDADIGEYLRRMRVKRGLRQNDVAETLGIAQSTISALEKLGQGQYLGRLVRFLDPEFPGDPNDRDDLKARAAEIMLQPAPEPGGWRPASSTVIATDTAA